MPVTHLLALDVEASGPSVTLHWCPEFGAALVDVESGAEVWRFHTYCAQPLGRTWFSKTLSEFWLTEKMLPRYNAILAAMPYAPSPQDAMKLFISAARAAVAKHVPGGAKGVQLAELGLLVERPATEVVQHPRRIGIVGIPVFAHDRDASGT